MRATMEQARFDIRLSKEQKLFFERAASLGDYRNLTDFIVQSVQEKAKEIIRENEQIIASERDCRIFFEAITHPASPNEALRRAADKYNSYFSE